VSIEIEARLFRWNDIIKDLEEDLKKKEEELAARAKELSKDKLISAQLQCDLKDEKYKVGR
ncbi:hypothetical protein KI387_040429, partial [Taxus chinensis]